jgi:hypothetical protein
MEGGIMDNIDRLLKWIQKTNPTMNKKKLIEELSKCQYSTIGLIMIWQNSEKQAV